MTGTVILTGAAGGLGFALAESIVTRPEANACIFTVRNQSSANAQPLHALPDTAPGKTIETHELDLATLDSVRAFAADINKRVASQTMPRIRALILNAAVIPGKQRLYTNADGAKVEMNFAVNYLANFLLTLLLLPSMDGENGRVVLVSSHAHDLQSATLSKHRPENLPWDLEDIARGVRTPEPGDEANDVMRRYGMSKCCQIMFMHQLQARIDATPRLNGVGVLAVNPGAMIHPNMLNKLDSPVMKYVVGPIAAGVFRAVQCFNPDGILRTVERSAADVQRAAFSLDDPLLGSQPKDLYLDGSKIVKPAADSFDETKQRELWDFSVKLVGLNEDDVLRCLGSV
ncbi:D-lactate ferricytochrome c oxidoreductase [Diplodia seriata]